VAAFNVAFVVIGALLVVGLLIAAIVLPLLSAVAKKRDEVASELRAELGDRLELIEPQARSFGLASRGASQTRGNGCLALTADRIVFVQWLPKDRLEIERAAIVRVETARSHLGKATSIPLVRVTFRQGDGEEDAIAWQLAEPDRVLSALS
jgi:hypothetical protein